MGHRVLPRQLWESKLGFTPGATSMMFVVQKAPGKRGYTYVRQNCLVRESAVVSCYPCKLWLLL